MDIDEPRIVNSHDVTLDAEYAEPEKLARDMREFIQRPVGEIVKQPVSEFPLPFACVPWGHHVRVKDDESKKFDMRIGKKRINRIFAGRKLRQP